MPVSPAFALIPCRVATASEALLCGTRCALSIRPTSRPYPTFAKSQDIGALPPQRRFRVAQHAPPEVDALRRIGSKAGVAPASARRSAASPIRGTALQRLLDPRLAAGSLLDWRSSVPFGGVVCRWRPALWVRTRPDDGLGQAQGADHLGVRTGELSPRRCPVNRLSLLRYRDKSAGQAPLGQKYFWNIITCGFAAPNHTTTACDRPPVVSWCAGVAIPKTFLTSEYP